MRKSVRSSQQSYQHQHTSYSWCIDKCSVNLMMQIRELLGLCLSSPRRCWAEAEVIHCSVSQWQQTATWQKAPVDSCAIKKVPSLKAKRWDWQATKAEPALSTWSRSVNSRVAELPANHQLNSRKIWRPVSLLMYLSRTHLTSCVVRLKPQDTKWPCR